MSVPKCELQEFPCINVNYDTFDNICRKELVGAVSASDILNHSEFCVLVPVDPNLKLDELGNRDYLNSLRSRVGLYHLWLDYDHCDDHDRYTMLCAYVGKGVAFDRILSHIKEKWPESEYLYVSFYECENRIAKYLEQLFLDCYEFPLNSAENAGTEKLFAAWEEERHQTGTELYNISDIYAKKIGPGPYEIG